MLVVNRKPGIDMLDFRINKIFKTLSQIFYAIWYNISLNNLCTYLTFQHIILNILYLAILKYSHAYMNAHHTKGLLMIRGTEENNE